MKHAISAHTRAVDEKRARFGRTWDEMTQTEKQRDAYVTLRVCSHSRTQVNLPAMSTTAATKNRSGWSHMKA